MSIDVQAVFPQETIEVTSVGVVVGSEDRILEVVGDDFSSVDTVEVNELEAPSFRVLTKTSMYVELPAEISPANVNSVTVISKRLVLTDRSLLRFRIGKVPGKVTGILKLAQLFLKILFTRPGSDIFSKNIGGGGLRNLGRTFSKTENGSIISDFVVSVQNTTRQLIAVQSRQPKLPMDEKILNARITSSQFSIQEAALLVTIELTSHAGRSALLNVVV